MKNNLLLGLLLFLTTATFAQLNTTHQSTTTYSQTLSDIWGYADDEGNEYAIVGLKTGVNILDVTNPASPVDLGTASGDNSSWRDIKTWGERAFIINENNNGSGVMVIDLSNLPTPITADDYYNWEPTIAGVGTITDCHNIWVDENGIGYLTGCVGNNGGGAIFIDLNDPDTITYIGKGAAIYSHDIYTRNDIMYASEIYEGRVAIYDVSDKSDVDFLGAQTTPFDFTHNAWLSDDGQTVFTTDEKVDAFVAAYDVSDPTDIILLDRFRPLATLNGGVIPHNVHVIDDFLVISHYIDGVVIVDASVPDNLIEVGNYDTYTGGSTGFNGCWGAYPFLPSGNILVSDMTSGCFVVAPTYVRAARLNGHVTDAADGSSLANVEVKIMTTEANEEDSDLFGKYKTGLATAGTYDVTFSKDGYVPKTISVTLTNGVEVTENVQLNVAALDIDLVSFDAALVDQKDVQVDWKAMSDDEFITFAIERSVNGVDFELVGELVDRSPSLTEKAYTYLDKAVPQEVLLYRLKMIEPNGTISYSPIKSVDNKKGRDPKISIYPNPVVGGQQLVFENNNLDQRANISIQIYNNIGSLIHQLAFSGEQERLHFETDNLPTGVYFVKIFNDGIILNVEKIVVK